MVATTAGHSFLSINEWMLGTAGGSAHDAISPTKLDRDKSAPKSHDLRCVRERLHERYAQVRDLPFWKPKLQFFPYTKTMHAGAVSVHNNGNNKYWI